MSSSSSSVHAQCSSSSTGFSLNLSNDEIDCHSMELLDSNSSANDVSPTIAVRGSITLSSGRYLSSLSVPLSYSSQQQQSQQQQQLYTSLSSATPTLSSLLNTPSLLTGSSHQQMNLLKSTSSNNSSNLCNRAPTSHNPPLPSMKNRNIVAANPLLAGEDKFLSYSTVDGISYFSDFNKTVCILQRNWRLQRLLSRQPPVLTSPSHLASVLQTPSSRWSLKQPHHPSALFHPFRCSPRHSISTAK